MSTKNQFLVKNVNVIFRHSEVQSKVKLDTNVCEQWNPQRNECNSEEIFGTGKNVHLEARLLVRLANTASVLLAQMLYILAS